MASLGRGVGGQLLDDAHLDVPLETLLDLLFPVQGDPVGDGVTCWIWWGQVLNVEDL